MFPLLHFISRAEKLCIWELARKAFTLSTVKESVEAGLDIFSQSYTVSLPISSPFFLKYVLFPLLLNFKYIHRMQSLVNSTKLEFFSSLFPQETVMYHCLQTDRRGGGGEGHPPPKIFKNHSRAFLF